MAAPAKGPPAPRQRTGVVIGALLLVMLLASLDQTIVSTALPTIVGEMGGISHISWVVTAYLLAQTVVTPLYGKLGDLYGRKRILQVAVVVFLIGSILCGIAQDLLQLIVFRAVQGLGGGGLMVGAQAAIGDVVPPRRRGRYNGLFGAVFGASAVAGPLIGGFLTSALSWRWIFLINIPLGALALVVIATALPSRAERESHSIDYLGTLLLAGGLSALVLLTTLGGGEFAWASPQIAALGVGAVVMLVAFGFVERRATEPVLAPRLFRNRVFLATSAVGFVVGFAMFGAITFLPLFQQVVKGLSPTASGLALLPLMGGLLVASIGSGVIITRTGRYRVFPIAGTAVAAVGLLLLSRLTRDTPEVVMGVHMAIVGVGLGLVMQVLVLAVQNAVPYGDLGVATSGATLFRSIGGSLGTALLGAVFAGRLSSQLDASLPAGAAGDVGASTIDLSALAAPVRDAYLGAYTDSLSTVFLLAAAVAVVAFALSWLIREVPLRETVATAGVGEAFAIPREPSSLREMTRALGVLIGRPGVRATIEASAARAGVALSPAACWLLVRLSHDATADLAALARRNDIEPSSLDDALAELVAGGHVAEGDGAPRPTPAGHETAGRLVSAYRAQLAGMLEGWSPERHDELRALIERLSRETVPAPSRAPG